MAALERSVKNQFAKVFAASDSGLFKEMAETYLSEAAFLKSSAFKKVAKSRRLLVRNSRKRLFIGVGTELLLKALYLRIGYCINKPEDGKAPLRLPFTPAQASGWPLKAADTYTLDNLIGQLKKVVELQNPRVVQDGLRIAKVFRNKEGHVVTRTHKFNPSSYRAIEAALVELYAIAFGEKLTVCFSFGPKEQGAWRVRPNQGMHPSAQKPGGG